MTDKLTLSTADGVQLEAVSQTTASDRRRGAVLLAQGITVDMDEGGGMFIRLADR